MSGEAMKHRDVIKLIEADGWHWNEPPAVTAFTSIRRSPEPSLSLIMAPRTFPGDAEEYSEAGRAGQIMRDYLVIYEQGKDGGWGAYAPDLPGLGVAAESREEVETLIREGIQIYIEELQADSLPIPEAVTSADRVTVAA
jgi:predicted RNase H-like HicB family nuclease